MSAKLIMKRKRVNQLQSPQKEDQPSNAPTEEKRTRLENYNSNTQSPTNSTEQEEEEQHLPNSILMEALQKIVELQAELDAFTDDLDEREAEEDALDAEVAANFVNDIPPIAQRSEAEALGFAMCARETLLFLQSEGVSTESTLYKALLGKLMGQAEEGLLQI